MRRMNRLIKAVEYMKQHRDSVENWTHGAMISVLETDEALCIAYEDGSIFKYYETDKGLEWC